jgi:hypothetical protein
MKHFLEKQEDKDGCAESSVQNEFKAHIQEVNVVEKINNNEPVIDKQSKKTNENNSNINSNNNNNSQPQSQSDKDKEKKNNKKGKGKDKCIIF